MRASRGEIKIEEILKEAGLPFQMEYSFPGLRSSSGRLLRFDHADGEDTQLSMLQQCAMGRGEGLHAARTV